jgi:hypothetical protein
MKGIFYDEIPENGEVGGISGFLFGKKKKKPVSEEVASDVVNAGVAKFSKGGRIDGCAIKGHTKGRNI